MAGSAAHQQRRVELGEWLEQDATDLKATNGQFSTEDEGHEAKELPALANILSTGTYLWIYQFYHIRVAQEPNWNRKPEPSEPFFPKPKAEPEPPEPFSRNRHRNRNRSFLLKCAEAPKIPFLAEGGEPPEPTTGTARTVPAPNRNQTEPGSPCHMQQPHSGHTNCWTDNMTRIPQAKQTWGDDLPRRSTKATSKKR